MREALCVYYVNENIKNLHREKFHNERESVLRLDMNENPRGLPRDFVEEVKKKITPEFLATYPEKDSLTALIASHNDVGSECISITCGSDEAMRLIFQCYGEQKKQLVTVTPTFEMYDVYSKMFGMEHIAAEYDEEFSVSADDIANLIGQNTSIVILLNPNSPIGTVYSEQEVRMIVEKANENDALVVIDEAYHYFYENTFIPLIKEYDNLIVLRTFSKLCSIAGVRIGYSVGNAQLIHYIENAESTFNVANIAILFAEEILKHPEMMEELKGIEHEGHQWLANKLNSAGYRVFSLNGNYLLLKPKRPSGEIISDLKKKGVWVRDYGKGMLAGWIRVSTGNKKCMERFWNELIKVDI